MKITKSQLKQIIKEELGRALSEGGHSLPSPVEDSGNFETFEAHKKRISDVLGAVLKFDFTTPTEEEVAEIQKRLRDHYYVDHNDETYTLIFINHPKRIEILYDYIDGRFTEN